MEEHTQVLQYLLSSTNNMFLYTFADLFNYYISDMA